MAELSGPAGGASASGSERERELLIRIAELEALVEARTSTILGLAAELAEHQGRIEAPTTFAAARLAAVERDLATLRATKVIRYSEVPRRVYARVRRASRG